MALKEGTPQTHALLWNTAHYAQFNNKSARVALFPDIEWALDEVCTTGLIA
jgi:hypothetical protein